MPLTELTFVADQYDYTLTLLLMPDAEPLYGHESDEDPPDTLG